MIKDKLKSKDFERQIVFNMWKKGIFLNKVEEIVYQRNIEFRAQNLLEACNRQCPELLETYARIGLFTDDWAQLKNHFESNSKEKARIS